MYDYGASLIRVVDGDTVHLNVDLGCDVHINLTCRFAGLDAPEISTNEGKAARAWVENWFAHTPHVGIRTFKDRREKYGRYLVTVYDITDPDGPTLNDRLLTEGLAVAYDGGKRG